MIYDEWSMQLHESEILKLTSAAYSARVAIILALTQIPPQQTAITTVLNKALAELNEVLT